MTALSVAERLRRSRRDRREYLRRSLTRRSHSRFRRDLALVPHVFLAPEAVVTSPLLRPAEEILAALRGRAVWTLDTASRLAGGGGLVARGDLTGYLRRGDLEALVDRGLAGPPAGGRASIDPLFEGPRCLIAHLVADPPPAIELATGDRVVTRERLLRDILGTLGWRPDLLTRVEAVYPGGPDGVAPAVG
jgi:hypothetical protein